jgi:hypothetical protein
MSNLKLPTPKKYNSQIKGEWIGYPHTELIYNQIYITQKYQNILHILPFIELGIGETNFYDKKRLFQFGIRDWNKMKFLELNKTNLNELDDYIKLYKNTSKRYTFYPITQQYTNEENERFSHSLFFLYDKKFNQIELFNSVKDDFNPYKSMIKILFTKIYGKNIKIIYPNNKCRNLGSLHIEKCDKFHPNYLSEGYCVIWTLWYLEVILKNPTLTNKQIQEKVIKTLKYGKDNICKIAISYADFINEITKKFELKITNNKVTIIIRKTTYIIPKVLITLLGITGAIFYILKKFSIQFKK